MKKTFYKILAFLSIVSVLISAIAVSSFAYGNTGYPYGSDYEIYSVFPFYHVGYNRTGANGNYIYSNHPTNNALNVHNSSVPKFPQTQTSGATKLSVNYGEGVTDMFQSGAFFDVEYTFTPSYYGSGTSGALIATIKDVIVGNSGITKDMTLEELLSFR